jgi:hypothetical protein
MRRPGSRALPSLCRVLACALAFGTAPLAAQQFDSFGDGPLEGFAPLPEGAGGLVISDPEIGLQITDGTSGITFEALPGTSGAITSISQPETSQATRVTLRALDRMLGQPTDIEMGVGETVIYGRIVIHVRECRFPTADPASDAFGFVEILDQQGNGLFAGWMIASAPAINALEHPRYDVWVLRCAAQ